MLDAKKELEIYLKIRDAQIKDLGMTEGAIQVLSFLITDANKKDEIAVAPAEAIDAEVVK